MGYENAGKYFNSIKVRLERLTTFVNKDSAIFQFHKGTIRTELERSISLASSYFNSIKVRLERFTLFLPSFLTAFQFHKGTIRTLGR